MTWQILAPVILAGLLVVAATVLVSVAAAHGTGDVARWAAISTIWLVIPVLFLGLVVLLVLVAIAYAMAAAAGFIPPYTRQAQLFASRIEAGVRQVAAIAYRPGSIFPILRQWTQQAVRRARGR